MVGGGIYFVSRMEAKLGIIAENHRSFLDTIREIKRDVESIETKVENHGLVLARLSQQEDRLVAIDNRINELSRRLEDHTHPTPKSRRR